MTDTPRRKTPYLTSHETPFSRLDVPIVADKPIDFYVKWVVHIFGTGLWCDSAEIVRMTAPVREEISEDVASTLLSLFDYRARFVGASFVALRRFEKLESHVGRLLLRSDFAFSGSAFCIALARLNSKTATGFIVDYLDYYLTRPDLHFDQAFALAALSHLDQTNGTSLRAPFLPRWKAFVGDSTYDALPAQERFFQKMVLANEAAAAAGA